MRKESEESISLKEKLINNLKNNGKSEELIGKVGNEIDFTSYYGESNGSGFK